MIKVVQIGCGKMSKYTMRYAYEKGASIVGAFDADPFIIGSDIGTVLESEEKGIAIEDVKKLESTLKLIKPDIAIVTTMSLLNDIADTLRLCARCGINVITICEEAFFPSNSNPNLYKEIDVLAKSNNCTITGVGYQDVAWGNLVATLAGTTHKITKIKGSSSYNVEDYGIALAEAHGVGLCFAEFEEKIASVDNISNLERNLLIENREFLPSYMWNTVGWLADRLELKITDIKQSCVPIFAEDELYSCTLKMTIPKGDVIGMRAIVTAVTEENIILEAECIGKVYSDVEFDVNEWTILGEPDTTVTINRPKTVELTCANAINRIPDVINAPAGFVPTSRMETASYKSKPLHEYIK